VSNVTAGSLPTSFSISRFQAHFQRLLVLVALGKDAIQGSLVTSETLEQLVAMFQRKSQWRDRCKA